VNRNCWASIEQHSEQELLEQDKGPSIMQDYKDTNEEDSAPTVEVEMAVQKLKN